MDITITINTDNAAFEGHDESYEVARILGELAEDIENNGVEDQSLRDINGNTVGHLTI